jgi:hypothetical protein
MEKYKQTTLCIIYQEATESDYGLNQKRQQTFRV